MNTQLHSPTNYLSLVLQLVADKEFDPNRERRVGVGGPNREEGSENREPTLEVERRTGESRSSAGLSPGGIAKYEDREAKGGESGSEGGGIDLNLGTPAEPVLSAARSGGLGTAASEGTSSAVRRSEKEVAVMKEEGVAKEKDGGWELAEVSRLPPEEAMNRRLLRMTG